MLKVSTAAQRSPRWPLKFCQAVSFALHRLRIPYSHPVISIVNTRKAYSEKSNRCDDAPVLRACQALDGAARKAGFGDGTAAFSVELLGSHGLKLKSVEILDSCQFYGI